MVTTVLPAERDWRAVLQAIEVPIVSFDPTQSRHTWRVTATDYAESAIFLPALANLYHQALGNRLVVLGLTSARVVRQAECGDTLRLSSRFDEPPCFAQTNGLRSIIRRSLA